MKNPFAISILASVLALGSLALASCGGDDDGATADAAPSQGCSASFASCTDFTDETAETTFSVTTGPGNVYTPKCIKVKVGTVVTIAASTVHPFGSAACNTAPIAATGGTAPVTFTPSAAGTYGFYCTAHGSTTGTGMSGAIQVVP